MATIGSRLWSLLEHQIGQDQGTLQLVFGGASDALLRGERLVIPDFGTLYLRDVPAQRKWHPASQGYKDVAPHRRLAFREAAGFKARLRD